MEWIARTIGEVVADVLSQRAEGADLVKAAVLDSPEVTQLRAELDKHFTEQRAEIMSSLAAVSIDIEAEIAEVRKLADPRKRWWLN